MPISRVGSQNRVGNTKGDAASLHRRGNRQLVYNGTGTGPASVGRTAYPFVLMSKVLKFRVKDKLEEFKKRKRGKKAESLPSAD